jgi:starvation-inducible DNA-binding protein
MIRQKGVKPMLNMELSNGAAAIKTSDNGMSSIVRKEIVDLLNRRLADTLDLMLRAKQAHWTVTGPNFLNLHELFDKIAEGAWGRADYLAERVMQLGGMAEGTAQVVAGISHLDPYPVVISDSVEHVARMSSTLSKYVRLIRTAIVECEHRGDAASADLFTEVSRAADKWLWLVGSHRKRPFGELGKKGRS